MYTTMAFFALTASITSGNLTPAPTWQTDYRTAQTHVASAGKPMAIFIATGNAGWESVLKDGIDAGTKRVLAEKFVCLFVDASTAPGRDLAEAFALTRGLVISDRTGTAQAYSLAGDLTKDELARTLDKYSDGKAVETTETVLRGTELAYGGSCASGKCSTGTCSTGTCATTTACATGTCGSPVMHMASAPCSTGHCGTQTATYGSSRQGGFGCFKSKCGNTMPTCGTPCAAPAPCATSNCGTTRSGCFGGMKGSFGGFGMKSCGGSSCSSGGCR